MRGLDPEPGSTQQDLYGIRQDSNFDGLLENDQYPTKKPDQTFTRDEVNRRFLEAKRAWQRERPDRKPRPAQLSSAKPGPGRESDAEAAAKRLLPESAELEGRSPAGIAASLKFIGIDFQYLGKNNDI